MVYAASRDGIDDTGYLLEMETRLCAGDTECADTDVCTVTGCDPTVPFSGIDGSYVEQLYCSVQE